jgi:hypothetical protein
VEVVDLLLLLEVVVEEQFSLVEVEVVDLMILVVVVEEE